MNDREKIYLRGIELARKYSVYSVAAANTASIEECENVKKCLEELSISFCNAAVCFSEISCLHQDFE
jgi:hypothetical protein